MVYIPLNALTLGLRGVGCALYFEADANSVCRPTYFGMFASSSAVGSVFASTTSIVTTAACASFCWSNTPKGVIQGGITFDPNGGICACTKPSTDPVNNNHRASASSTSVALVLGSCAASGAGLPTFGGCANIRFPTLCPLYYSFDSTHYCQPSSFARYPNYDFPVGTTLLGQGSFLPFPPPTSEGNCFAACAAGSPPTLQTTPSPLRAFSWTLAGGCKCAASDVQAPGAPFVPTPLSVVYLIGNCAKYNKGSSFGSCEDVIWTPSSNVDRFSSPISSTCTEVVGSLPCKCLDPNTQTCLTTGASLLCNPNYSLNSNSVCTYSGFARYIGYASYGNDIPGANGDMPTYLSSMLESSCATLCQASGTCVAFAWIPAACGLKSAGSSAAAPFKAAPGIVTSIIGTCKSNNMMVQGVLIPCEDVKFRGLGATLISDGVTPAKCAPLYSLDPSSNSCKATQFARFINYSLQGIYSISTNAVTEITCSSSCQAAAPHYSFVWNSLTSTCWCGNSAAVSVEPLFIVSPGSAVNIVGNCINYPISGSSGLAYCEDATYTPSAGCRRVLDGNGCACFGTGVSSITSGGVAVCRAALVSSSGPKLCPAFPNTLTCDSNGNPTCPFQWGFNPDKTNPGCIKCIGYDPSQATTLTPSNTNTCSCDANGTCGVSTTTGANIQLQIKQCNHQYAHLSSKTSTGQVNESCSLCVKGYTSMNVADYQSSKCCLAGFTWMGGASSGCTAN